jgi:alpha-tubulin suppressor-like RCC1 family protein
MTTHRWFAILEVGFLFFFISTVVHADGVQPKVCAGWAHTVGIKPNGTAVATGANNYAQCNVSGWTDIVQLAAGYYHTVGLKFDGTVVATGWNEHGQCNVSDWTGIVQVAAGRGHTVGLKSNGTVVSVGDNWYDQCNVSEWTDIVQVAAGWLVTLGVSDLRQSRRLEMCEPLKADDHREPPQGGFYLNMPN